MGRGAVVASSLLLAHSLMSATMAVAQAELRGRVVDSTGRAIAAATVTIGSLRFTLRTDSAGAFKFSGTPGSTLSLRINATGFRPDTASAVLPRGRFLERDFVLVSEDAPLPEANPSDRVLSGRVLDPQGTLLAYANIQVNGGRRYVADDSGRFRIPITISGGLTLLVRRIGFEVGEVKLAGMPDTALTIRLVPAAVTLPETRVVAAPYRSLDLHGFYRRMAESQRGIARGWFITPEELEQRRPARVTTAVEWIPNIRIRPIPVQGTMNLIQNLRIENTDKGGCPLTVYLDRMVVQPTRVRGRLVDEQVNNLVGITSLAGIEVYSQGISAPPEYPWVAGTCGVVLLWTK